MTRWLALAFVLLSALAAPLPVGADAETLIVSPTGPFTTIESALAAAQPGDTIEVRGGAYPALTVAKSVTLIGVGWPVIDGGGAGTVVTLEAPGVVFSGFQVQGSGVEPDRDHAGITLTASTITVENNRLTDVLFGIFVAQADNAIVRGNDIASKAQYELGRKGDGIRLWYSRDVLIENNVVHDSRDVVLWYSQNVIVRNNSILGGRYGIHLMYCNGARIENNDVRGNSVGIYTMYSSEVVLSGNDLRGQRGPSGYALGFKDADDVVITGNLIADNRAGVFLDGTPFSPQGQAAFTDNILAFNDVGVILLTAVRGNAFTGNTFWENTEQVAVQGGGFAGENLWRGNYWSDYSGFDLDADGRGDLPYRSERLFESLAGREPLLRALHHSPAAQAIEFAAASFPIFKPQPKLTDESPLMEPAPVPASARGSNRPPAPMVALAAGLLALGLGAAAASRESGRSLSQSRHAGASRIIMSSESDPLLQIEKAGKRYGPHTVLDDVSITIRPGESVALWGENGAGKTTLLKAVLGLVTSTGRIMVQGRDVRRGGKAARQCIGYVPQEAAFYDMTVQATLQFFARLKKVGFARIPPLLDTLGLTEHAAKTVPTLSGGLKQRLALAVALLADPPILLLDEPTANLDAKARRDYLALLAGLRNQGKTLIFASHRIEEVEQLADRVVILESGRVAADLTPGEVRLRLAPQAQLTLWVPSEDRQRALACMQSAGWAAHLNGRGTVVVQVAAADKLRPLARLAEAGIAVTDLEIEGGRLWN